YARVVTELQGLCGLLRAPAGSTNMLAGDREHVGEARHVHGFVHWRRDRVPLASDERRGDRSLVARQDRADALVDGFAHAVDERGVAQPQPGWVPRLDRAHGTQHETRGANTLE